MPILSVSSSRRACWRAWRAGAAGWCSASSSFIPANRRSSTAAKPGAIDDRTFLQRIHYREEWGYPWDGFRDLLDAARDLGVQVLALDRPPRGGFDGLRRRDEHAARGIAAVLAERPRTAMMVLFGESHLARNHMPIRVERLLAKRGLTRRSVTIFQDPEPVYWAALAQAGSLPQSVRLKSGSFAIFHTPPLARYECYRQVLERWRGETPPDEDVDLTPAVHHLMDTLVGWMGLRPDRHRLRHRAGWIDDLQDAYPEVYCGTDAGQLLGPSSRSTGARGRKSAKRDVCWQGETRSTTRARTHFSCFDICPARRRARRLDS
jgi:hypothetical protein